jgi:hypothetical protein
MGVNNLLQENEDIEDIETGMAEKSSWDQANRRAKLDLVWRNRKKISQIIKDYFYLPFFLLIILCSQPIPVIHHYRYVSKMQGVATLHHKR